MFTNYNNSAVFGVNDTESFQSTLNENEIPVIVGSINISGELDVCFTSLAE